jgi:Cdc6-like AAA superfamily ATPase
VLFCPGKPGSGKTMITAIVIEHLLTRFLDDSTIAVVYLYCNFRRQHEQTSEDLLISLLKQLIQCRGSIDGRIQRTKSRPQMEELLELIDLAIANFSSVYILIDALDECGLSDGHCRKILSLVSRFPRQYRVRLFVTSRFIPEILKTFQGDLIITKEIIAHENDVRTYLEEHMTKLSLCVLRSPDLQHEIQSTIINSTDGM